MTRSITRRAAIGGLALAGASSLLPRIPARAAAPSFAFLTMGDWGRDGASHQRDVATQMGRTAEHEGSLFTVTTGDNFYENGVQSVDDPQWKTSFEDVYTAPSLQRPWYGVLGNHDYRGNPQAQLDYAGRSTRWRLPSRYYKIEGACFGMPHIDMFMLDTSPIVEKYRGHKAGALRANVANQDFEAQKRWLDNELGRSKAAWKLVFAHHPVFSGGSSHGNTPEMIGQVKPLLERHGVQAFINGHDHDMQHIRRDGVSYFGTGSGSEIRPVKAIEGTEFYLARSGFASFRSSPDTLDMEFRDYTGKRVYRTALGRTPAKQPA